MGGTSGKSQGRTHAKQQTPVTIGESRTGANADIPSRHNGHTTGVCKLEQKERALRRLV